MEGKKQQENKWLEGDKEGQEEEENKRAKWAGSRRGDANTAMDNGGVTQCKGHKLYSISVECKLKYAGGVLSYNTDCLYS